MVEAQEGFYWLPLNLTGLSRLPSLPTGAVIAGYEHGRPTYVARVRWAGRWELGKLNAWAKFGYGYFGKEIEDVEGEVLVARDDHSPVWINGAFGEHVPAVMMSQGPEGFQSVGRAWHQGRWVPGKVVHACRALFFPFGGKELSVRKYQLLSTGFVWKTAAGDAIPGAAICTDEQPPRLGSGSNLIRSSPSIHATQSDPILVKVTETRDCIWVVSGDGEFVRHAIAGFDGRPLARVWVENNGTCGWVGGVVSAPGPCGHHAGVHIEGRLYRDYQVLTAGTPEPGPRMLTLHLQLDAAGQVTNSSDPPSKDVLLATALEKGASPWVAVVQMVTLAEEKLREKAVQVDRGSQTQPVTQSMTQPIPQPMMRPVSLMDEPPSVQIPATAADLRLPEVAVEDEEEQLTDTGSGISIIELDSAIAEGQQTRAAQVGEEAVAEPHITAQEDSGHVQPANSSQGEAKVAEDVTERAGSEAAVSEGSWEAPVNPAEASVERSEEASEEEFEAFQPLSEAGPAEIPVDQLEYEDTSDEYEFVDEVSYIP